MRGFLILLLVMSFAFDIRAYSVDLNEKMYLLFGVGIADMNLEDNSTKIARALGLHAKQEKRFVGTFKGGIGLEINQNFGVETYFQYLGKSKMEFSTSSGNTQNVTSGELDAYLYHIDLVGKLPLNQLHDELYLLTRVGYARSQSNVTVKYGSLSSEGESNGNEVAYGAGFEFKNFRVEYQQLNNIADDPRIYTLGYIFRFKQL